MLQCCVSRPSYHSLFLGMHFHHRSCCLRVCGFSLSVDCSLQLVETSNFWAHRCCDIITSTCQYSELGFWDIGKKQLHNVCGSVSIYEAFLRWCLDILMLRCVTISSVSQLTCFTVLWALFIAKKHLVFQPLCHSASRLYYFYSFLKYLFCSKLMCFILRILWIPCAP